MRGGEMIMGMVALVGAAVASVIACAMFVFRGRRTRNAADAGVIPAKSGNANVVSIVIAQVVPAGLLVISEVVNCKVARCQRVSLR